MSYQIVESRSSSLYYNKKIFRILDRKFQQDWQNYFFNYFQNKRLINCGKLMSFSATFKFLHTVLCWRKNLYYENKTIGFSLLKVLMKISARFIFQLVQTSTRISKISKLKFSATQYLLYTIIWLFTTRLLLYYHFTFQLWKNTHKHER